MIAVALLSGCSLPGAGQKPAQDAAAARAPQTVFPSQFTRDGTYQSHINIDNVDYVFTLFANKATPRTNLWYARGDKVFSMSLTAYDLDRRLRDPFATKRKVWLGDIRVTSSTRNPGHGSQSPYHLDARAARITFDPEPQRDRHGMLITSPKGSFELRNQKIGSVAVGTVGVTLHYTATVYAQAGAHSARYRRHVLHLNVPITIFPGTARTAHQAIPLDAN